MMLIRSFCRILFCVLLAQASFAFAGVQADADQPVAPILIKGTPDAAGRAQVWYKNDDPKLLRNRIRALEKDLVQTRREMSELRKQHRSDQRHISSVDNVRDQYQRKLDRLSKRLEESKGRADSLWQQLAARDRVEVEPPAPTVITKTVTDPALTADLEKARAEIVLLSGAVSDKDAEITSLREQLDVLAKSVPPATPAADTSTIDALKAERDRARRQYEHQREISREKTKEVERLKTALAAPESAPPPTTVEENAAEPGPVDTVVLSVPDEISAPAPVAKDAEALAAVPAAAMDKGADPSPYTLIAEGNRLLQRGRVADAEDAFRRALEFNVNLVGAQLGVAACLYTRNALSETKAQIQSVLENDPVNPQALGLQGIIAWRDGDSGRAVTVLKKAVSHDPEDAQLRNYLGIVLNSLDQPRKAVRELRRAIELDPTHAEAQFNLAVLLAMGTSLDLEQARLHYENAVHNGSQRDQRLENILFP